MAVAAADEYVGNARRYAVRVASGTHVSAV